MSIATPFPPTLAPTAVPRADASACSRQSLLVRGLRLAGARALRATFARVLLAVALALAAGTVAAQPALTARAWTLLDVNSGTLLARHRADEFRERLRDAERLVSALRGVEAGQAFLRALRRR